MSTDKNEELKRQDAKKTGMQPPMNADRRTGSRWRWLDRLDLGRMREDPASILL